MKKKDLGKYTIKNSLGESVFVDCSKKEVSVNGIIQECKLRRKDILQPWVVVDHFLSHPSELVTVSAMEQKCDVSSSKSFKNSFNAAVNFLKEYVGECAVECEKREILDQKKSSKEEYYKFKGDVVPFDSFGILLNKKNNYLTALFNKLESFNGRDQATLVEDKKLSESYIFTGLIKDNEMIQSPLIKTNDKILLRSSAGMGKSAFSSVVAATAASKSVLSVLSESSESYSFYSEAHKKIFGDNSENFFPIIIECKNYKPESDLLDFAACADCEGFQQLYNEAKNNNNLLLIIDGLDEVPLNYARDFKKSLKDLLEEAKNTTIIVTSRLIKEFKSQVSFFKKYKLPGFQKNTLEKLIGRYPLDDKENIRKFIIENETLTKLCENPFVAQKILFELNKNPGDLSIYTIIGDYISNIVERSKKEMDSNQELLEKIGAVNIITIFGKLAWKMICSNEMLINENEFRNELENSLEESKTIGDMSIPKDKKEALIFNYEQLMNLVGIIDILDDNNRIEVKFNSCFVKQYLAANYLANRNFRNKRGDKSKNVVVSNILEDVATCGYNKSVLETFSMLITSETGNNKSEYLIKGISDVLILKALDTPKEEKVISVIRDVLEGKYGLTPYCTDEPMDQYRSRKELFNFLVKNNDEG